MFSLVFKPPSFVHTGTAISTSPLLRPRFAGWGATSAPKVGTLDSFGFAVSVYVVYVHLCSMIMACSLMFFDMFRDTEHDVSVPPSPNRGEPVAILPFGWSALGHQVREPNGELIQMLVFVPFWLNLSRDFSCLPT